MRVNLEEQRRKIAEMNARRTLWEKIKDSLVNLVIGVLSAIVRIF